MSEKNNEKKLKQIGSFILLNHLPPRQGIRIYSLSQAAQTWQRSQLF